MRISTPSCPASYWAFVEPAALPAIVPPVASMTTFGFAISEATKTKSSKISFLMAILSVKILINSTMSSIKVLLKYAYIKNVILELNFMFYSEKF